MPRHKHVERLLAKAAQDEYVVHRLLPDDEAPVEAFGFHAQQAAEMESDRRKLGMRPGTRGNRLREGSNSARD